MKLVEYYLSQTSDVSGDSVDEFERPIFGRLCGVAVVDGDLEDNFDITLTYVNAGIGTITLLTLTDLSDDAMYYPREQVCGNTGAGLDYNDESDEPVAEPPIIAGTVTSTLADGGATKTGAVLLYVWE